jgi:GNAT superfamily N-acetyltransferase/predicted FMN-binding regulatory protein PaiB
MIGMRREIFRSDRGVALLARAPYVHLAGVDDEGRPVGRTVHGVVVGDRLCFHAAPAGEKMAMLGKPVVVWAEEVVAEVPSYFMDAVRACPATTLYESVQVHGVLERVDGVEMKAAVLSALMTKFQPEGGHVPIDPSHARYRELYESAVRGILIASISLANVDGKSKLAQNKSPAEVARLVDQLWRRGAPGDARAIDLVLDANPACSVPSFLAAPPGVKLRLEMKSAPAACCDSDGAAVVATTAGHDVDSSRGAHGVGERVSDRADEVAALLADAYWNVGVSRAQIAAAHRASSAWVGALDEHGAIVASARALADGAKWATIYDVIVRGDFRGKGIGTALVKLLLEHPAVRGCKKVNLRTRDAQGVYAKLGFVEKPATANIEMLLARV